MKKRTVSEMKIYLGKVIKEEIREAPQVITYRKKEVAVIISYEEYEKLLFLKK